MQQQAVAPDRLETLPEAAAAPAQQRHIVPRRSYAGRQLRPPLLLHLVQLAGQQGQALLEGGRLLLGILLGIRCRCRLLVGSRWVRVSARQCRGGGSTSLSIFFFSPAAAGTPCLAAAEEQARLSTHLALRLIAVLSEPAQRRMEEPRQLGWNGMSGLHPVARLQSAQKSCAAARRDTWSHTSPRLTCPAAAPGR